MKVFLALIIIGICFGQSDSLIQLGNGATLQNLDILTKLNTDELSCQTNLLQLSHQFKMWAELLQDEKVIHKEIKVLSNASQDIQQLTFNRHRFSETLKKAKIVLAALKHNTHKNQHTLYQQWRQNEISKFKKEIKLLQTSTTQSDSTECCDRIEKLLNKFLDERKHISNQCNDPKITINVINDKENSVKIINKTCKDDDSSIKVNRVDSRNVIVGQSQEKKREKVASQKVEGEDFDGKIEGHGKSEFESKQVDEKSDEYEIMDGTVHGEGIQGEYEKFEVEEHKVEDVEDFDGTVEGNAEFDSEEYQTQEYVVEEGEYMTGEIAGSVVEYSEDEYSILTKASTTQKVTKPPVDDDEEVEGELVSVQGVGASGEKGRQ